LKNPEFKGRRTLHGKREKRQKTCFNKKKWQFKKKIKDLGEYKKRGTVLHSVKKGKAPSQWRKKSPAVNTQTRNPLT